MPANKKNSNPNPTASNCTPNRGVVIQGRGISPSPSKNPWNATMTADGRWSPSYAEVVSRSVSPTLTSLPAMVAQRSTSVTEAAPMPQTPVLRPAQATDDIPHLSLPPASTAQADAAPAIVQPSAEASAVSYVDRPPASSPGSPLALAVQRKKDKGKRKASAKKSAQRTAVASIGVGPPPTIPTQEERTPSEARKRRRVTDDNGDEASIGEPTRSQPSPTSTRRLEETVAAAAVEDASATDQADIRKKRPCPQVVALSSRQDKSFDFKCVVLDLSDLKDIVNPQNPLESSLNQTRYVLSRALS
ncbi:uncharacterized protein B0H18DRAFT_1123157 [Fomitopsis serialis]|uniref:uncharacterized protein n=1 Tax=Fomitopsis serialis TaxID=139415 RepID=UPI0020085B0F|nr:uncharacterized protein B0H18DRAFT_1123157 [Neoantrodia serialis]KAH9918111.1 hypothetical protein B0H18DRAFT_1123157 [Neoantrodia serialis]